MLLAKIEVISTVQEDFEISRQRGHMSSQKQTSCLLLQSTKSYQPNRPMQQLEPDHALLASNRILIDMDKNADSFSFFLRMITASAQMTLKYRIMWWCWHTSFSFDDDAFRLRGKMEFQLQLWHPSNCESCSIFVSTCFNTKVVWIRHLCGCFRFCCRILFASAPGFSLRSSIVDPASQPAFKSVRLC